MIDTRCDYQPTSSNVEDLLQAKELQSPVNANKTLLIICFVSAFATFDFGIFRFLANNLSVVFFVESGDGLSQSLKILSVTAVGFIARPIGSYLMGRYGDVKGRKPALHLGLSFLFVTSLAAACLPTYDQVGIIATVLLILVRIIQGAAFANQLSLGWVYVTESLLKKHFAMNLGWVGGSFVFGAFASGAFVAYLNHIFASEQMIAFAWRIPFAVSTILGLLGYYLVSRLDETPLFLVGDTNLQSLHKSSTSVLNFTRTHTILFTGFSCLIYTSVMNLFASLLPKLIDSQISMDAAKLRMISITGMLFLAIGMVFYGWLADKLNVGRALTIGAVLLCIQTVIMQLIMLYGNLNYLVPIYALLGFCSGFVGLCPVIFVYLFPTRNRLTSTSVIYNVMTVFTGLILPFLILYMVQYTSFAPALYFIFTALCALFMSYYAYQVPQLYEHKTDEQ